MEDIIEKVRKLLAVARDSGATENEQAQALKLAQRLMIKYGIDNVDEKTGNIEWGNAITELDKKHHKIIALAVGRLYGAKPIFQTAGKGSFTFVGREETRTAAEMTVNYIADQIDLLYCNGLPKGMSKSERSQWRREFKNACSTRVAVRIEEMVKEITTDDRVAEEAIGCTALVVLGHFDQLKAEVDDFLAGKTVPGRALKPVRANTDAAQQGFKAGEKVKINQEIGKSMPKRLASSAA